MLSMWLNLFYFCGGGGISLGVGVLQNQKVKEMYKAQLQFPEGGGGGGQY